MLKKIEDIAKQACQEVGVALYDVKLKNASKGKILLIYITKIDGVTVDECQQVSRIMNMELETLDIIPGRYFLEVSSPGLERELNLKKHYVSAINENVKLTYSQQEKNVHIEGILKEVLPEHIKIETDREELIIPFSDIKKAKTYFEYKKKRK
ncbi:MAG: ribosome assembly cofactor RimP [Candidatus Cloacimonadota bacterium]|nr:ribosome assembly cofactor RimP [Candidatus Cloacimonadota bacterium]